MDPLTLVNKYTSALKLTKRLLANTLTSFDDLFFILVGKYGNDIRPYVKQIYTSLYASVDDEVFSNMWDVEDVREYDSNIDLFREDINTYYKKGIVLTYGDNDIWFTVPLYEFVNSPAHYSTIDADLLEDIEQKSGIHPTFQEAIKKFESTGEDSIHENLKRQIEHIESCEIKLTESEIIDSFEDGDFMTADQLEKALSKITSPSEPTVYDYSF